MSDLESLKKQAKQIVRWHRDGYAPVAAQIRETLPRFSQLTDRQILEREFKLSDAQEMVARRSGFESWRELKEGMDGAAPREGGSPDGPRLLGSEPQLFVSDIQAACEFYTDRLGFKVAFVYGEPPFYAQIFRDAAPLNLRQVDEPVFGPAAGGEDRDLLSATIVLDDAKALFLEFKESGVTFHQTLRTEPWGARTFIVRDPDGNLVAFASGTGVGVVRVH